MKKKILFIIYQLKIGGGAEKVASELSTQLSDNYEVSFLTLNDFKEKYLFDGKYYTLKENLNQKGSRINIFMKIKHLLLRFIKIYKAIKSISPDLMISFMDLTNINAIFIKKFFRIKSPLIITVHCNPKIVYRENMRFLNYIIKLLYSSKSVNKIVTISKEIENILEKEYLIDRDKIITIYNGINPKKIKNLKDEVITEYREIFDNDKIIKFITVGRFCEEKGYEYLIKAFSEVRKQIPESKLILIGDGPLYNTIKNLIKKERLEKDIILLGLRRNPFKYLSKSDIFILSSITEGLGIVILEALACEIPIISTDCVGPKEILDNGKYGLIVKKMDSKELAEKMIILANDKKLLNLYSNQSFKRAEFFDIEKITDLWRNLINSCIN